MHNLAIDLQDLGHDVTGSDDEIYEPSLSKLSKYGLLPKEMGWNDRRISSDIDVIILGKHAKKDNPELIKALELGIPIKSFPEFISELSKARTTIAITGSHGKTTTTAMAMFVMKAAGLDFDYLVGAQITGFEKMVRMSGADILIVEGDEYPSSCLDNRAKMLHYKADLSVVTGIAWDHVNIYKTYAAYKAIFDRYLKNRHSTDLIFFDQSDKELLDLMLDHPYDCKRIGYQPFEINKQGAIIWEDQVYPIKVFGAHNLKNMNVARLVCNEIGISTTTFLDHIKDFTGAAKRLETIYEQAEFVIYKDFAHAPSKAKATADAVRSKHSKAKIVAVLELHTFSSLTKSFIEHYHQTLDAVDEAVVFYDPHAVEMKKMPALDRDEVHAAFAHNSLEVLSDSKELSAKMKQLSASMPEVLLIMSSGNLGGIDLLGHFDS